jgi:drug/metabolite transporter (DMT)-like permease
MFTAVLAYIFLGERISYFDWVAVIMTVLGIVVLENPFRNTIEFKKSNEWASSIGSASALIGAVTTSIAMLLMRKIGQRVDPFVIMLYSYLSNSVVSGILIIVSYYAFN